VHGSVKIVGEMGGELLMNQAEIREVIKDDQCFGLNFMIRDKGE
jgi:hypothetical protein